MSRRPSLLLALLPALVSGHARQGAAESPPVPVLVELFSSEGCSSCPPADALLKELSQPGAIDRAEVIGLEWHVDYWNDLGWADPLSTPDATARQHDYARQFGRSDVYTPQMVVNGSVQFTGSDARRARSSIERAAAGSDVQIALTTRPGDHVRVKTTPVPQGSTLLLAITESNLATAIPSGENAGRTVAHGPVVRWATVLTSSGSGELTVDRALRIQPGWRRENAAVVAWVQDFDGHVVGAARVPLAP